MKFIPKATIDNKPVFVWVMARAEQTTGHY